MTEHLFTRRDFLAKGAATLGIASVLGVEGLRSKEAEPLELTYDKAITDAIRFSSLLESMPSELRVGVKTQRDLDSWMKEIVPYFEYENVNEDGEVGEWNGLVYPKLAFEDYQDGLYSHHVLGRAMIYADEISLNARISNPVSPWYGREDSVGTLVHELAHANGVKFPAPNSNLDHEASAQLVTLEVLSAMVNHGNKKALPALLDEFYYMSMQAARFIAIRDGYEDRFLADRDKILTDPFDQANAAKADRMWDEYDDEDKYPYILEAYNYNPMNAVYKGFRHNDEIYGVKLPINWLVDMINQPYSPGYSDASTGGYGVANPPEPIPQRYGLPEAPKPLVVDDLHYFYDNADELVQAVIYDHERD